MNHRLTAVAALAAASALVSLGATSASAAPVAAAPAAVASAHGAKSVVITISSFAFTVSGAVRPGGRVTVHNHDVVAHTVTSNKAHHFNVEIKAGGTRTFTAPRKAGRYAFHCSIHPEMHGTLVVR